MKIVQDSNKTNSRLRYISAGGSVRGLLLHLATVAQLPRGQVFLRDLHRSPDNLGHLAHLFHSSRARLSRHSGLLRYHSHSILNHIRGSNTKDLLHGDTLGQGEGVRSKIRIDGSKSRFKDQHDPQAGQHNAPCQLCRFEYKLYLFSVLNLISTVSFIAFFTTSTRKSLMKNILCPQTRPFYDYVHPGGSTTNLQVSSAYPNYYGSSSPHQKYIDRSLQGHRYEENSWIQQLWVPYGNARSE